MSNRLWWICQLWLLFLLRARKTCNYLEEAIEVKIKIIAIFKWMKLKSICEVWGLEKYYFRPVATNWRNMAAIQRRRWETRWLSIFAFWANFFWEKIIPLNFVFWVGKFIQFGEERLPLSTTKNRWRSWKTGRSGQLWRRLGKQWQILTPASVRLSSNVTFHNGHIWFI